MPSPAEGMLVEIRVPEVTPSMWATVWRWSPTAGRPRRPPPGAGPEPPRRLPSRAPAPAPRRPPTPAEPTPAPAAPAPAGGRSGSVPAARRRRGPTADGGRRAGGAVGARAVARGAAAVDENGIDPAEITGTAPAGASPAPTSSAFIDHRGRRCPGPGPAPGAPAQPRSARTGTGPAAPAGRASATGTAGTANPTRSSLSPTSAAGRPSTWCGPRPRALTPWSPSRSTTSRSSGAALPKGPVQGGGGVLPHLPAIHRPGHGRGAARVAAPELLGGRRRPHRAPRGEPGRGRRPRLQRAHGAGREAGRGANAAGHGTRTSTIWPTTPASKSLTADDISGGTFTLTNAGPFGTFLTVPIINQPQVAILSTDGVKKPAVVDVPDGTEAIVIHSLGMLAMSWDHRAFDGAYAAAFLAAIKRDPRDAGLGCRAVSAAAACSGSAGSGRSATGGPRPAAGPVGARRR